MVGRLQFKFKFFRHKNKNKRLTDRYQEQESADIAHYQPIAPMETFTEIRKPSADAVLALLHQALLFFYVHFVAAKTRKID